MEQFTCLNCGNKLTDKYCNQCGQQKTHRYTVGHVLHELVHVFTHADKGIFSFVWHIISKPGIIALDLVEGRRKRHFNLFQYLLLIVGFTTFLIVKTDFIGQVTNTMNTANEIKISAKLSAAQQEVTSLFQKYNNILQMLLIPIFSLFSWLFFARKKYNYAEIIVLHTASSAQTNTFAIATTSLFFLIKSSSGFALVTVLSILVMIFSYTISYKQFFKFSVGKSLLYAFLVFICTYIVQIILMGVFMILYFIFTK